MRPTPVGAPARCGARRTERLGVVAYTNVAPLHWGLAPGPGLRFVRGVPTELNRQLLAGEIDLTLISSVEFVRHRDRLRALPDFSVATLGPVYSVTLFHWRPWEALSGARVALSTDSATSVALLKVLLRAAGLRATFVPMAPDLDVMLGRCDAALLIGDVALREAVARRPLGGKTPLMTDLGAAWYALTKLPFTFAVWASLENRPPSERLVAELRAAREAGLGQLGAVARAEAEKLGLSPSVVQRYLGNFRYYLETPDRDGLLAFAERVAPGIRASELKFWAL
ncbi:menaquinone biosynthetic enzyme MqnA/MqnD family protein [Truepera radiovictrix]|uniref:Chorismate dehydratase n=1 Tax=Truepera radiovictrix (strain DSM 17093 / CIP 108686 / LMG 22925 / RQ-24) TaxID=649638 RepID=D7CUQ1_TRURR|nr:menaquinone biosynthesis protein [Truepera radiovictrix]ADI14042.1 protein of unknown function DUF178 [Truepera radiovictrix DSM 17093]WMT57397.1 menaquinone biosynthesis protein [Truepera radiovictrix]